MVTRQSQNVAPAIDWDEVLTPPQELAAATRELIPAASTLSAVDLEQMAIAIRERPELWEPLLVDRCAQASLPLAVRGRAHRHLGAVLDARAVHRLPRPRHLRRRHRDRPGHGRRAPAAAARPARRRWSCAPATRVRGPRATSTRSPTARAFPPVSIHCYSPPLMRVGPVPRRLRGHPAARRRARPPRARRRDDRARCPRARLTST